ncbi:stanniocalcin-like [Dunckerocampus dactyliophorus]|uniref:stanniocalcin-like n=1 Tax=Dunckerocampus dactyliophorus TaxID=161453 RepID=UPI0024074FC5|nr:stanniocalcin-like [Dunckerocampus dactyliophorus]
MTSTSFAAPLLVLVLASASCFDLVPEEAAPRRARFSSNSPADVARCLNGAVAVGCGFFSCLENSTCDTDGMHEICELFLHSAATFNTEGKTFVKKSLQCIAQGISAKVFQTIRRCNIFQRMIAEVEEECFSSLDICTVARTNPDAIGEVVQVPAHFPNRYYSTLLQTLQACDQQTVAAVRAGLVARLGPDMETFLQMVQNKECGAGQAAAAPFSDPASWRNVPVFNIQPGFQGRDPTHLFARKRRSLDDQEAEPSSRQ